MPSSLTPLVPVKSLQIHATHACNLACEGCTSFSQYKVKGMLTPEVARDWMDRWKKKIIPTKVCVLGGEPTLNPDLCEILKIVGSAFRSSKTKRLITTNGFFLHKHPQLEKTLRKYDIELRLSLHSGDSEYLNHLKENLDKINRWRGISILYTNNSGQRIESFHFNDEKWTRRYVEKDGQIYPFGNSNPRQSWEVCTARDSMQLHDGKLWKCPLIAYVRLVDSRKRTSPDWNKYLKYQGLASDCSYEELVEFANREEEFICGMCPTHTVSFEKPNPMKNNR